MHPPRHVRRQTPAGWAVFALGVVSLALAWPVLNVLAAFTVLGMLGNEANFSTAVLAVWAVPAGLGALSSVLLRQRARGRWWLPLLLTAPLAWVGVGLLHDTMTPATPVEVTSPRLPNRPPVTVTRETHVLKGGITIGAFPGGSCGVDARGRRSDVWTQLKLTGLPAGGVTLAVRDAGDPAGALIRATTTPDADDAPFVTFHFPPERARGLADAVSWQLVSLTTTNDTLDLEPLKWTYAPAC